MRTSPLKSMPPAKNSNPPNTMKTTHSPGPLTYGTKKDGSPNAIFDSLNRIVCSFPAVHTDATGGNDIRKGSPHTAETMGANARLFTAAPDLLAAAIAILAKEEEMDTGHAWLEYRDLGNAVKAATRSARCNCYLDTPCNGPVPNYCPEHDGDYSSFLAANNCD